MSSISSIKPKNKGQKVMFDNPVLEKLTRTHISVPITIFVTAAVALATYAYRYTNLPKPAIGMLFGAGLLTFTLVEYIMHRYLFHMSTHTERREKLQYNFHGIHHEFPKDKGRLAMPPLVSVLLASGILGIFYLLMQEAAFAFFPGFILGYAGYLFVHYIVHAYQPPKNFFKTLWINHAVHHYKDQTKAYGVSSPLWDHVFRTMP
ncbi:MAG: sterol desaturase family protein [Ferruginibacter sp.]|nr:sterol desaturase family protein [Cytophagales bacterium]